MSTAIIITIITTITNTITSTPKMMIFIFVEATKTQRRTELSPLLSRFYSSQ
jgi:hypothetical protein